MIWAGVVVLVVTAPLALFALVGFPHVFRGPIIRHVMVDGATGRAPAIADPAFGLVFELVTGTRLTTGNRVKVLSNGDETYPRLWRDLRAARRSITVQMYYAGPGAVVDSAVRILSERARAGVVVFYLYDAFGTEAMPPRLLDTLRAAGARVAAFAPVRWYSLDRANHRSHVRAIVIDATIGYTGGFGLDDKWLGAGRRPREWRETNARFEGPVVVQLQNTFVAKWAEATGELHGGARILPADPLPARSLSTLPPAETVAGLAYSPPLSGSTIAERLLALSIASARQRLYITNAYFIPQADFVALLVNAARRGVDVRVLTNGSNSDVKTTWLAGRGRYEALLAGGVRIYEYQATTLHAKTFVADGIWASVGTMNFDNRSLAYNTEVALMIRDASLGATMDSIFLADVRESEEIRLATFRHRSRWMRIRERGSSVVAGLL
ncbi:MAG: phospholipase D-like domain-containing protein [Gemmatimonadaceae bacterium]